MKKIIIASLAGALALGGAAAVAAQPWNANDGGKLQPQAKISIEQAKKLALQAHAGTIKEIELELNNGRLVYELDYNNDETDVYVDAESGKVWQHHDDEDHDDHADSHAVPVGTPVKIDKEQAKRIALAKVAGTVKEVELDEDDGSYVYEVDIRTGKGKEAQVDVSATTGTVLKVEWDD
ncbi:PepSY domain-containing protein [Paenibacillus apiarius]|uniref:PepSY domain-containing protein n=1 Tax=Paenibacillus apiarius TaxID=46240 RepID=A0ABT4DPL6_9BACL|nr:PepSY domain-containing protein [Paenibacillus apiarius]MCY9517235.1 PepSY domain-containing protein [Paenibacillus apiarius]MCY9519170.1 PepSY domain-containing protein [Paenibacillus apiarius]MCY9551047.1 PepSY domain-containing protein [Paenibacillus apiarius]MCY9560034.1 PepSY domain-containing protein [Paenibacillus apiarius]MCY9683323.1 PepSY domain-containing protein [Paenibacillus apiarius]